MSQHAHRSCRSPDAFQARSVPGSLASQMPAAPFLPVCHSRKYRHRKVRGLSGWSVHIILPSPPLRSRGDVGIAPYAFRRVLPLNGARPNMSGVPSAPVPGSARSTLGRHRGLFSVPLVCTYHPTVPTPQVPGRCGHRPLREGGPECKNSPEAGGFRGEIATELTADPLPGTGPPRRPPG